MRIMIKRLSLFLLALWIAVPLALAAAAFDTPAELVGGMNDDAWEILRLTNKERMGRGLEPLSVFDTLQSAVNVRTEEIKTLFQHTRPDGTSCFTALDEAGVSCYRAAENIAMGYQTPADTMEGWMKSEGHRKNILTEEYAHAGMGSSENNWAQVFVVEGCSFDAMTVLPGPNGLFLSSDGSVEASGAAVCLHCTVHGDCYLPLIDEMCTLPAADASAVTVACWGLTAGFIPGEEPLFLDVDPLSYYYDAVLWAKESGVTNGVGNGRFSPDGRLNRAMAVTFLWRAAGSPAPKGGETFSDVMDGTYYADAVGWAVELGITNGIGGGEFGVDRDVTRGQMITFLWRLMGRPDDTGGAWYEAAEKWAETTGLLGGTAEPYRTDAVCPRSDVVLYLFRCIAQ